MKAEKHLPFKHLSYKYFIKIIIWLYMSLCIALVLTGLIKVFSHDGGWINYFILSMILFFFLLLVKVIAREKLTVSP